MHPSKEHPGSGPYVEYFNDGAVRDQGEYVGGKKAGEWNAWDPDGTLVTTTNHRVRS